MRSTIPTTVSEASASAASYYPVPAPLNRLCLQAQLTGVHVNVELLSSMYADTNHERIKRIAAATLVLARDSADQATVYSGAHRISKKSHRLTTFGPLKFEHLDQTEPAFVPRPGHLFVETGISAYELYTLAHISGDPFLLDHTSGTDTSDVFRHLSDVLTPLTKYETDLSRAAVKAEFFTSVWCSSKTTSRDLKQALRQVLPTLYTYVDAAKGDMGQVLRSSSDAQQRYQCDAFDVVAGRGLVVDVNHAQLVFEVPEGIAEQVAADLGNIPARPLRSFAQVLTYLP